MSSIIYRFTHLNTLNPTRFLASTMAASDYLFTISMQYTVDRLIRNNNTRCKLPLAFVYNSITLQFLT